jgi:hypothetical protein
MEDEMFRKLGLAIFALTSIAVVTPASADGISGEEGVRRTHVEYRYREPRYRDDGYRRVHHAEYRRDYVASNCYRVVYTEYGPRRVDASCD